MDINKLVEALYVAKSEEEAAKERRVALEAELAKAVALPDDWEGTKTKEMEGFKVVLTRKMNVKIDTNMLIEQARINNMLPMLDKCFRRKYELVKAEWRTADDKVKLAFAPAMTVTPGKASFTVERMDG